MILQSASFYGNKTSLQKGLIMFKRVAPYIGKYKKYTVAAAVLMALGIVASILPYFFVYQIISPLTRGEELDITCNCA